jgi:hypothetical protein
MGSVTAASASTTWEQGVLGFLVFFMGFQGFKMGFSKRPKQKNTSAAVGAAGFF